MMQRFAAALTLIACSWAALAADYAITPVKDNVYRFTAGHYHAIYVVTDDGILITDPIDAQAARWLQGKLAERHDVPLRYVVYSHNHIDHTRGGEVHAQDGVRFVAHRLAREDLARTRAPTQLPELVFDDALRIYLGDSEIRLRYHGSNNGRGSISMLILPARVLHVVDWIVVGRMPYRDLPGYDIHGMIDATREVLEMDFDRFVGGHAEIGDRADIEHYLGYLEALYAAVRDGMLAGRTLAELQASIRLDAWQDLKMYEEWLPLNVAGVYRTLADRSYIDQYRTPPDPR